MLLSGRATIATGSLNWTDVGGRETVFDGPPHAVYLPPATEFTVEALTNPLELAFCWAPAEMGAEPRHLDPLGCRVETRGEGSTRRTVHNILMADQAAETLLVTEVVTPGGNWSSYPPHKHDTDDPPRETYLEETYYHRIARPGGFAIQAVYDAERQLDDSLIVHDGDVVLVPRGYHPVVAGPGYDLYYLNVMAGPVRQWLTTVDPDHRWQVPSAPAQK